MTDERIQAHARFWLGLGLHNGMEATLVATIKAALAERDAEIAAWARDPGTGSLEGYVQLGDLLVFLQGGPDAG